MFVKKQEKLLYVQTKTLTNCRFAVLSGKVLSAGACVTLDTVDAHCVVQAHVRVAVIDIDVTIYARKAWIALTHERQQGISACAVYTGIGQAIVKL